MNAELMAALEQLEQEKNISKDIVLEALEVALATAYKRNSGPAGDIVAEVDRLTGEIKVYAQKTVVDEVEDPTIQISLEEARGISSVYAVGDVAKIYATPDKFGRIAAQTAKQIIVQRIREAEREKVFSAYNERVNDVITGIIQKTDHRGALIDIGSLEALLPAAEMIKGEKYLPHQRIKVYVTEVKNMPKGLQVTVSRTHPGLVNCLFTQEVPEIMDGTVEIKAVSREAGSRSKIAVYSDNPKVDPIGACVGQRGMRVDAVVESLGNEKIDIIKYSDDPAAFITASLSPAKTVAIELNEETKTALVTVPEFQLSLAIGKEGQNVRLAARLTGWKIDIKSDSAKHDADSAEDDNAGESVKEQ